MIHDVVARGGRTWEECGRVKYLFLICARACILGSVSKTEAYVFSGGGTNDHAGNVSWYSFHNGDTRWFNPSSLPRGEFVDRFLATEATFTQVRQDKRLE